MINFFRNKADKFLNILTYYIVGPALVLLLVYDLIHNPRKLFDLTHVRGHYQTTLIMGLVGLILTIIGLVKLAKKENRKS